MREQILFDVIKENEALIYSIARKYTQYYCIDDLYQVGVIGLLKAYNNFDQNNEIKFSSYAYKYVFGEIISYIKKDRNIIISDEVFSIYKKYLKVRDILFIRNEREATISEISAFMEISESKLVNIIESVAFTKCIEENINTYKDDRKEIDEIIDLNNELSHLSNFEKNIINYRYYLGYNQSQTANIMGISQSTISREEVSILKKLKNNLN